MPIKSIFREKKASKISRKDVVRLKLEVIHGDAFELTTVCPPALTHPDATISRVVKEGTYLFHLERMAIFI
jgi:hypothetical protein